MPIHTTEPFAAVADPPERRRDRLWLIALALLVLAAAFVAWSPAATAQSTILLVTTSLDDNQLGGGVSDCSEGCNTCTLREAVNIAESGDEIEFADDIYPQLMEGLGQILIAEKDVAIVGNLDGTSPGTTISGREVGEDDHDNRLFEVTDAASLTISNVTLTGAVGTARVIQPGKVERSATSGASMPPTSHSRTTWPTPVELSGTWAGPSSSVPAPSGATPPSSAAMSRTETETSNPSTACSTTTLRTLVQRS